MTKCNMKIYCILETDIELWCMFGIFDVYAISLQTFLDPGFSMLDICTDVQHENLLQGRIQEFLGGGGAQ